MSLSLAYPNWPAALILPTCAGASCITRRKKRAKAVLGDEQAWF
jgi:hypothetical protein